MTGEPYEPHEYAQRDHVTENIRRQAREASERFRAMDPRGHGYRILELARTKNSDQRQQDAHFMAELDQIGLALASLLNPPTEATK